MGPLISFLVGFATIMLMGATTDQIWQNVYDSGNTALRVNQVAGGGAASSMTVGSTTISGGTNGRILYDNSAVLGELAIPLSIANGGTNSTSTPTSQDVCYGNGTAIKCDSSFFIFDGTNVSVAGSIKSYNKLNAGSAGVNTGKLELEGTTSGVVSVKIQDAAGTYNFNLPTTAGSSGQYLISGGGGSTAQSYTSVGNFTTLTYSGTLNASDIHSQTTSGTVAHRFEVCGSGAAGTVTMTLPASPAVGDIYTLIQRNASNTCVFARAGSQTIDGATTATLSAGVAIGKDCTVVYMASNDWHASGACT